MNTNLNIHILASFASRTWRNSPIPEDVLLDDVVIEGVGNAVLVTDQEDMCKGFSGFKIIICDAPSLMKQTASKIYVTLDELNSFLGNRIAYVYGSEKLLKNTLLYAQRVTAWIHNSLDNTRNQLQDRFPIELMEPFEIALFNKNGSTFFTKRRSLSHGEGVYLDLLRDIMANGNSRPDRTGVGTKSVFGRQLRFDISDSVPVLTTKFLAWKAVLKELLWFLRGQTDSKVLENQGVSIWSGNTTREFLDNRGLVDYEVGDIGPMYGFNWRHYGAEYSGCSADYQGKGFDQLEELVQGIKKDPYSRRHLLTTYNPQLVSKSVLAPCHGIACQFYVTDDSLSCIVFNRSQDTFLGLPFNLASYAFMTYIIAARCDLKPSELVMFTGDTHIYNNHFDQIQVQLSRTPLPFPKFKVSDSVKNKQFDELCLDDFSLEGYIYHPSIKAPMAV